MNPLIQQFGNEKRWVNWKLVPKDGKMTKIPTQINGRSASSTDPSTWSTYDEAKRTSDLVGIVFTNDQTLIGIDIDKCVNKETIEHAQKEIIESLISKANTYTEVSPSGTGLHLFIRCDGPIVLQGNRKSPYEFYVTGRYFTFTGIVFGIPKEVRTVTHEELQSILSLTGYPWNQPNITTPHPTNLDDNTLLQKAFKAKKAFSALYNGDISNYNNDNSSADLALCSSLSFWTGRDTTQIERIWLASPLGQREKTQKRLDYRTATIQKAIQGTSSVYKIAKEIDFLRLTKYNKDGTEERNIIIQCTENICRVFKDHPSFKGNLRYDSFKNIYEIKVFKSNWRMLEDNDAVVLQTMISQMYPAFVKVGKDMVYDAVIKIAKENSIDSAKDFITSLVWDNIPRLDTWLGSVYGVEDNIYHRAVASNWIKGLVKRITEPGCKFDFVLVLEGEQGTKKSTSLGILGGDWHVETTMSTDSKDFFMQFQGKAIIEFSEGETLSRTEVKRMKAIITMQSDKYRPPYGRTSQDFPRRCVFAMTTNQTEYLKDETGNRRWLPVRLVGGEANTEWLQINREQLFAEAYARLQAGETVYDFPKKDTLEMQQARRIRDPNTDKVIDWYVSDITDGNREEGITVGQVYERVFYNGSPTRPMDKYNEMIIATILKDDLCLTKRRISKSGVQITRWFNDSKVVEAKDELDVFK